MAWRILIVDDEDDVRLIVRTTLEAKYEVVEAHDGLDALEKMERYEPDFVVMDVMMPLMNGFEACTAIRKNTNYSEVPVMFLSALGSTEDMKKGYSAGANLYLTKPFDPSRLLKNVDVFFEKTPPPVRPKRHTIDQIKNFEKEGRQPMAPGGRDYAPHTEETQKHFDPAIMEDTEVSPAPSGMKPRILVVDDDQEMCTLMRMTLTDYYEVVFAHDGMQAIERLVKYQPDMLIIDVMLPKMNGYQLCQSLRSNRAFKRIPILMCSAKGTDRDINLAKRIGADDYLVKPFGRTDLIEKVNGMRNRPGFRIASKTFKIEQIVEMEHPDDEDRFALDDDIRGKRESRSLKKFLAREGEKDGIERTEEEPKKKRRLFGFGGKD